MFTQCAGTSIEMKCKNTINKITPCLEKQGFIKVWDREDITVFENQIDYTHRIRIRIDHKLKVMAFFSYSDRTRSINPPNEILRCITQDEYKIVKGAK